MAFSGAEDTAPRRRGLQRSSPVPEIDADDIGGNPSVADRTDALLDGLTLVLEQHGASGEIRSELVTQISSYLNSSDDERVWLKRAKHLLTYPMSKYLRNQAPKSPDVAFAPRGILKRWIKPRLMAFCRRNTHLWYSWLQSKRAALPASDAFVNATYDEHFQALTATDRGDDTTIGRIMENKTFCRVLDEVATGVLENLQKFLPRHEHMQCSHNASFEKKRGQGGQARHLGESAGLLRRRGGLKKMTHAQYDARFTRDPEDWLLAFGECSDPSWAYKMDSRELMRQAREAEDNEDDSVPFPDDLVKYTDCEFLEVWTPDTIRESELLSMRLVPCRWRQKTSRGTEYRTDWQVQEVRGTDPRGWLDAFGVKVPRQPSVDALLEFVNGHKLRYQPKNRALRCTIQAVLEPFKVRVISKGEAEPYHKCRPLQKALHETIRNMSCFRLTGKPFCASMLADISRRAHVDDQWFSVDYSAATDNLSYKFSSQIFDRVISKIPVDYQALAREVLGMHDLYYPKPFQAPEFRGRQTSGQLMGSVLSFPILCLANLGVYLDVTEHEHHNWNYQHRLDAVLVNGDDMLYAAPPHLWSVHEKVSENVGLSMSPGKAYCHPEYANVNSVSVHCKIATRATPFRIDYFNAGLFLGQRKVQERGNESSDFDTRQTTCKSVSVDRLKRLYASAHLSQDPNAGFVSNIPLLLEGTLEHDRCRMLANYLSRNKESIRRECAAVLVQNGKTKLHTRNLFLSQHFGGMGIVPPRGFKFRTTYTDRLLASSLMEQRSDPYDWSLPLRGESCRTYEPVVPDPWQDVIPAEVVPSYCLTSRRPMDGRRSKLPCYWFFSDHNWAQCPPLEVSVDFGAVTVVMPNAVDYNRQNLQCAVLEDKEDRKERNRLERLFSRPVDWDFSLSRPPVGDSLWESDAQWPSDDGFWFRPDPCEGFARVEGCGLCGVGHSVPHSH